MVVDQQGAQDTINADSDADGVANVRITIPRVLPSYTRVTAAQTSLCHLTEVSVKNVADLLSCSLMAPVHA